MLCFLFFNHVINELNSMADAFFFFSLDPRHGEIFKSLLNHKWHLKWKLKDEQMSATVKHHRFFLTKCNKEHGTRILNHDRATQKSAIILYTHSYMASRFGILAINYMVSTWNNMNDSGKISFGEASVVDFPHMHTSDSHSTNFWDHFSTFIHTRSTCFHFIYM